jgi:FkbM family methyltransferase
MYDKLTMRDPISWILKETEGISLSDSLILFFIKLSYLSLRILLRLVLGKERRDKWYIKRALDFGTFWYFAFNFFFPNAKNLLRFKSKRYGYEFHCRLNKDDFKVMTIHEDELMQYFTPEAGDLVVDVGAHIGHYTLTAAKRVGIEGKVFAIEADPANFEILIKNISLNNLENVIALNYAAYSEKGEMNLYLRNSDFGFTKYSTVIQDFTNHKEKSVIVKANTLDALVNQYEVNWIKIDVEGAELEVLKGATRLLSNSKRLTLLIEVHNHERLTAKVIQLVKQYNFITKFQRVYKENESIHIILQNIV